MQQRKCSLFKVSPGARGKLGVPKGRGLCHHLVQDHGSSRPIYTVAPSWRPWLGHLAEGESVNANCTRPGRWLSLKLLKVTAPRSSRGSLVVRLSFLSVIAVTVEQGFPAPLHSYWQACIRTCRWRLMYAGRMRLPTDARACLVRMSAPAPLCMWISFPCNCLTKSLSADV